MVFTTFNLGSGTNHDSASTRFVCILHTLYTIDGSTGWEVRSRDILHQSICINVRIIDICTATINHLTQVVGRHIGSHTYGNTVTTIYQKIRNLGRHHGRLLQGIIEVVGHINRFLVKVIHDMLTHLGEAALCITHGSRRVTVNRTEVTLSVNQGITHVPLLSHTHQSAVNRRVAVRVILTEHLTNNTRTFLIRFVTGVSNAEHTVKNTAVHRLETIAYIREGTSHDN